MTFWKWSRFLDLYWNKGDDVQKYFCNKIIGIITGVGQEKISKLHLDSKISDQILLFEGKCMENSIQFKDISNKTTIENPQETILNIHNSDFINIEHIFLPIHDKTIVEINRNLCDLDVNMVKSTRTNLRSLALAVSANKPVCLNGPVGCGKTMLVEYLARKTGRLLDFNHEKIDNDEMIEIDTKVQKRKRKSGMKELNSKLNGNSQHQEKTSSLSAFLRIQLGDQTDSKTLLGQYR